MRPSVLSLPVAGLVALAVALSGCGGGGTQDAAGGSRDALRRADAVCADLAHRSDAVQTLAAGTSRASATARAYAALAELTVDRADQLEQTVGSATSSMELRRYLAAVHREASLGWSVRRAIAQGDLPRARRLVEEATATSASTRALARSAGLRVCGERA